MSNEKECLAFQLPYRRVVLTGGPGSGKTAVLELARKSFCSHMGILPESASIIFGGGFPRSRTVAGMKASQRAIYFVQRELEALEAEERKIGITLCDRGTLDGLAYWPNSEKSFFEELGTTREKEFERYFAVIHLRTPTLDQGYNHSNPLRIESAREAAAIDEKILTTWRGHPSVHIIESHRSFFEKAQHAFDIIKSILPSCCRVHEIAP